MIQLVAFLGNHGKQYAGNRHNVAWQFAESLSFESSLSWQKKFRGKYASLSVEQNGERVQIHFLKPETFMNLSGEAIGEACSFYRLKPEQVLVVHDELELPLGTVSLKWSGGLGGHNGLRSTKTVLSTPDFWRLRFGIGRPPHPDVSSWVLSDFTADERISLSLVWPPAGDLLENVLANGPEAYLKEWAKKKITG
ncbi:aminoacyl-tRNA hydrolase [Treponema zuelzerae]|uniref:Peptidyl-tRNA hydrolase n=1 Tax=Teretinema zuelzerae TaxID=156 RepID=A0AAE3EL14_9SPIR|nr:aminoacyl-tRNA hydrolase [Teretinema zuelzerae]MCD1655463.1 aminoacyl-tRNA hydrolase [Teretinema zuelzerae]